MQRYFIDQSKTAGKVILPEEVAHHLVTVLRAAVGTKFELVTADHQAYLAELISITPGNVIALSLIHISPGLGGYRECY